MTEVDSCKNILLLGCGTQGLALAKDISEAGHRVYLVGDRNNYADASKYVYKKYYCDFRPSSKEFLQFVISVLQDEHVDVVIPLADVTAEFLSINKKVLNPMTNYLLPDIDNFNRGVDKNKLMELCKEKQYPHPFTINTIDDIYDITPDTLSFPLLIKPNITCGARGMTLVDSYQELIDKYPAIKEEYGDCHLQKYIRAGGAQVEVQLYIDENRELVCSTVIYKYRWYPEKGGSSCCAKSVRNDKIVNILYHLLLDLNWVGFADFDTIEDPETGELLIMELNPRVPACVKCPIEAGIRWGEIIVNGYLGRKQKSYQYKEGEYLRHLGFEVLWFLKSKNKFRTKPNWFHFLGKHIHYQDMSGWRDPMPFIRGTMHNVIKVLRHKEKEKIER